MAVMLVKSSMHTALHTARSFHSFVIGATKGDPPNPFASKADRTLPDCSKP